MPERRSCWTSRAALAVLLVLALAGSAGPAAAQDDLARACGSALVPAECRLAAAAARTILPRVGLALWGGNPEPGTASTAGVRLRGSPRVSVSARFVAVPMTLPPLTDRSRTQSAAAVAGAASVQTTVGVVHGLSPLPTVGGLLSLDLVGRLGYDRLPGGEGFRTSGVWGWAAGARLGLLRESFTVPGVSVTAMYGRSGTVTFGDPAGLTTDGAIEGRVSALSATLAASRRIFGLRLAAGTSYDRYTSEARLRYAGLVGTAVATGDAVMKRRSMFGSVAWTRLIYHVVLELGWQESPVPTGLPVGVRVDPTGWWAGLALRVTP